MYKKQIEAYIDSQRQNMINDIFELVSINSVKAEAKPGMPFGEGANSALEKAMEIAQKHGFKTTTYDGYVGAVDLSEKETALDILAHLDIVPANPVEWTICPPFSPVEQDGKLYGRGVSDDKGPGIMALYAMKAIRELNIPVSKNVRLLLGTDEENGSSDIEYYYKNNPPAPATFSPDAEFPVINVEKGAFRSKILTKYPLETQLPRIISVDCGHTTNVIPDTATIIIEGLSEKDIAPLIKSWSKKTNQTAKLESTDNLLTITTKGVGGHAASPEHANNALTAVLELVAQLPLADSEMFRKLKGLSSLFPHKDWDGKALGINLHDEISGALTISFTILHANENGFSATFDSRTPIVSNDSNTLNVVKSRCDELGFSLDILGISQPHHVDADSPFIKVLLNAYEQYTGNKGECIAIGGGTYVHGLENGVAFGAVMPGTKNNVHGADELLIVEDMLTATKIFAQVIVDMCI